jgi:hypothetical protein
MNKAKTLIIDIVAACNFLVLFYFLDYEQVHRNEISTIKRHNIYFAVWIPTYIAALLWLVKRLRRVISNNDVVRSCLIDENNMVRVEPRVTLFIICIPFMIIIKRLIKLLVWGI